MEENLSRIPFTREEEETISSMARWMRFMAVVGIVSGFLILFVLVLGAGLIAAGQELGEKLDKILEKLDALEKRVREVEKKVKE